MVCGSPTSPAGAVASPWRGQAQLRALALVGVAVAMMLGVTASCTASRHADNVSGLSDEELHALRMRGLKRISSTGLPIDPAGYLLYCPCMGRFGNQASHLLGVLAKAKEVNRILVVPPFITYSQRPIGLIPYTELFDLAQLEKYHRVISMEAFMGLLAPEVWPPAQRYMYCAQHTQGDVDCRTKQGNPFGPFWDAFNVDFVADRGIMWNADWATALSPSSHFVVAMRGAPATFPELPEHRHIARYIEWNASVHTATDEWISQHLQRPFVAAHLRAGADWRNVCDRIDGRFPQYMASPQCDYSGDITRAMCLPSVEEAAAKITEEVVRHDARSVFLATDNPSYAKKVAASIEHLVDARAVMATKGPMHDLVVMTKADLFLGNCVSSFTSFVTRYRRARNYLPVCFFGLHPATTGNGDSVNAIRDEDDDNDSHNDKASKAEALNASSSSSHRTSNGSPHHSEL